MEKVLTQNHIVNVNGVRTRTQVFLPATLVVFLLYNIFIYIPSFWGYDSKYLTLFRLE